MVVGEGVEARDVPEGTQISPMGNSGCLPRESQLRQSRATQSTVHVGCLSVSILHRTDMNYGVFNVRTDVKCMRLHTWVYGHRKRVCTDS